MSHHDHHISENGQTCCQEEDGCADAFAAVAIIAIFVTAVSYWLAGMA